ncbi:ABC transporter substrate-binding protein [Streptomyces reniochalinae]|uniref:Peptide ABC transporter substrate-binding protein n=1 Tax=Streptomyces reniochalinae TaxID=2250578 RepID=A0A367EHK8_9ACTN|nr:ABC transporter substrate-binding protein [Streptomyces reniochalinae]RCG17578.1 peptide ABC transporter substrate-binding protein [Streptomyces reniochalinae]
MPEERTRRHVLGLAGGGCAAALLSGCDGSASAGTTRPRRGGTLRAAFPGAGAKETLDPHKQRQFVDIARHKAMFDKLVELGPTLRPVPRLARSWESSADSTVWRFRLRKAVFHDGHRLEPEDVLYSLHRILDPHAADHLAANSLSALDLGNCRAVGKDTVELRLKKPSAEFPSLLAVTGALIVRRGYRNPEKPVGTGAFRFASFQAGRSLSAHRFDDHWAGAPYLDELRILSAESEARNSAVQAGEIDYAHEMSPTFARLIEGNSRVALVSTPLSGVDGFALKTDRPPFDDPDAAMAAKLLVDRERLIEVVSGNRAQPGNDLYGKGYAYYPSHLPQREQDLAQARRLARRSGLLNRRLTFYTSTVVDGFVNAAHLFADMAGEAGLRVEVVSGPPETYNTDQLTTGDIGNHRCGAMPIPTYISERLLDGSPQNASAWKHPDFDEDFVHAQGIKKETARTRAYGALQRTIRDEGGLVLWGHPDWLNAVATSVHGVKPAPPNTDDWARFDAVWVD